MTELRQTVANETNWVQRYRGPAEQTRHVLLDATLGSNLLAREAWERRAQMLQSELAGTHPTALERSICESIATCWLDMNLAAFTVAAKAKGGLTQGQQDFYQRRHDRAHARYLAAVQALARVRRLLAPTVAQLNIAQPGAQQLNLSASDRVVLPPRRAPDTITGEGAEGTGRHQ